MIQAAGVLALLSYVTSQTPTDVPTSAPTSACTITIRGMPSLETMFAGMQYNMSVEVTDPGDLKVVQVDANLQNCMYGCPAPCTQPNIGPTDNANTTKTTVAKKQFSFTAGPSKVYPASSATTCQVEFSQVYAPSPPCTLSAFFANGDVAVAPTISALTISVDYGAVPIGLTLQQQSASAKADDWQQVNYPLNLGDQDTSYKLVLTESLKPGSSDDTNVAMQFRAQSPQTELRFVPQTLYFSSSLDTESREKLFSVDAFATNTSTLKLPVKVTALGGVTLHHQYQQAVAHSSTITTRGEWSYSLKPAPTPVPNAFEEQSTNIAMAMIVIAGVFFVVFGAIFFRRVTRRRAQGRPIFTKEDSNFFNTGGQSLLENEYVNSQATEDWHIEMGNLKVVREVGRGMSAQVYLGAYYGQEVAVKQFYGSSQNKETFTEEFIEQFQNESRLMSRLHHPNVVRFYGSHLGDVGSKALMVTEFCSKGSLNDLIQQRAPEVQRVEFYHLASDIAKGMQFIHAKGLIHRDLKPDNVLMNNHSEVKLCDFGLSKLVKGDNTAAMITMTAGVGTPAYMAVEMISGEVQQFNGDDDDTKLPMQDSNKIDVFSMGVFLWALWTLQPPYEKMSRTLTPFSLMMRLVQGLRPTVPKDMPEALQDLMTSCWDHDPEVRPSFDAIVNSLQEIEASNTRQGEDAQPSTPKGDIEMRTFNAK
jgi:tRNA A-37 threonylcarbamoyl transferase component Bud32